MLKSVNTCSQIDDQKTKYSECKEFTVCFWSSIVYVNNIAWEMPTVFVVSQVKQKSNKVDHKSVGIQRKQTNDKSFQKKFKENSSVVNGKILQKEN